MLLLYREPTYYRHVILILLAIYYYAFVMRRIIYDLRVYFE